MKNYINKSAKRILSLALALVMLAGCLFTANIGVGITAAAETDPYADWDNVQYWDGTPLTGFWQPESSGEYLIRTAAQLQFACAAKRDNTIGKSFVIDPTVDAFIMQPKEVVDELGIAAFVEVSGAEETRELFEDKFTAIDATPVNWLTLSGNNALFNGDFDGSGVPIYGIYADAIATNVDNAGFFPGTRKNASGCMTIENLVIKNCYFKGYRRVSILSGCAWSADGNYATVDSCIFANCYLLGQNLKSDNTTVTYATNEMGLLGGGMSNEPIQLSNTLVYGNKTEYDLYEDTNSDGTYETVTPTPDAFKWLFKHNQGSSTYKGSVKNCIILDAVVNNLTADNTTYCENVYSNTYTTYKNTVTQMVDRESVKGAHGRYYMSGLGWDSEWWAIENDYPTPFKPSDNYVSVAAKEFEGSGTEADPYLIYCAKQLDTMVSEGGIRNSVRSYYKVADGVKEIYLNGDIKTKAEAIALYNNNTGTFNNWNHGTTAFEGHFDGNGVTIYGMISSNRGASGNVGFVSKLGTTEDCATSKTASIKNINFVGAYVNSSSVAAVVTSGVVGYKETTVDGTDFDTTNWGSNDVKHYSYISNISVRDSYIYANNSSFSGEATSHNGSAAGILALSETPDHVVISNCLYDGGSCVLEDGDTSNSREKSAKAGIVTMYSGGNEFTIENCVSINEYAIPMVSGITNYRYGSATTSALQFNTVFGKLNAELDTASTTYDKLANCYGIEADKTTFSMLDMPQLNWGGAWNLVEYNGRMIPMPKTSHNTVDDYSTQLAKQNNGKGATLPSGNRYGGYTSGQYGMYEKFLGTGTKDDPYIISNALDLARAIACGGKDITTKLYYKLSCDIDVGASWINENTIAGKYEYVPFEGHIDGDGHTIYNLVSIGGNAGLIPTIVGGASIKNLHIRNSNIIDTEGDGGAFFGKYQSDGNGTKVTLEGCSFEGAGVEGGVDYLVGNFAASIVTNSYAIGAIGTRYYINYPTITSSAAPTLENADFYGEEGVENPVWYKGGKGGCKPQLVNRAKAMSAVDISGYGDNDYDSDDIVSLRQRLLNNPAFANVYGDVNRDGKTDLGDLAILKRQLVGTYNMYADGFWRNAALGNIVIYYGENDNYDFARKLELALEDAFGKDVKKVVVTSKSDFSNVSWGNSIVKGNLYVHKNDICTDGTTYYKLNEDATTGAITPEPITAPAEIAKYALDGNCQIVVGNIDIANGTDYTNGTLGDNNYQINYDKANSAVWLQGGSFTAVEQATIDFINKSNPDNSYVHTTDGAVALDPNKVARTDIVNGKTYYYAWGDEFSGTSLHKDSWNYDAMHNETSTSTYASDNKWFSNLEVAFPEDIEKLYTVNDGRLTIWRGYYGETGSDLDWGYKYLGTQKTGNNKFGGNVEAGDNYVTAGKIVTNKSMLAKQGYLEMKAYYPSDGHAFPCWWLVGYSGGTQNSNNDISNTLFGKVFKLNNKAAYNGGDTANAWDGTDALNSSIPSTFKYQLPNASYEIDIAEFMQGGSEKDTMDFKTANFTFHKFYGNGIYNDGGVNKIKFINWNSLLTGGDAHHTVIFNNGFRVGTITNAVSSRSMSDTPVSTFLYDTQLKGTTSGLYKNYTTYNGEMIDFNTSSSYFSSTPGTVTIEGGQEYIFGVKWDATDTTALYTFTVKNANTGVNVMDPLTIQEDITYNQDEEDGVTTILSALSKLESDQQTANQYMYMLIDNTYYTSVEEDNIYNDMLTQNNAGTKIAKMEIDYVRVYQEKRDIVTPDTEEFNNGNHFGY